MSEKTQKIPPPWEALVLVSHYLDPQTIAIASCVSKSWSQTLSLDLIWQPLCCSRFPSLSNILKTSYPSPVPYRRIYAIGLAAFKLRNKLPPKPRLSLHNLVFAVEISTRQGGVPIFTAASKIDDIRENQVFKFDIDVNSEGHNFCGIDKGFEEINITWNVVLEGFDSWEAVFTMMDCKGKLSCGGAAVAEGWWFSEELPCKGCCSGEVGSGIVADLKVGIGAEMKVEKVSVGILRVVDWRYVSIDDGLRYLQHFLLPCGCDLNESYLDFQVKP